MIVKTGVPFKCPIGLSETQFDYRDDEVFEYRSPGHTEKRLFIEETR
jgi:hypothetical protein